MSSSLLSLSSPPTTFDLVLLHSSLTWNRPTFPNTTTFISRYRSDTLNPFCVIEKVYCRTRNIALLLHSHHPIQGHGVRARAYLTKQSFRSSLPNQPSSVNQRNKNKHSRAYKTKQNHKSCRLVRWILFFLLLHEEWTRVITSQLIGGVISWNGREATSKHVLLTFFFLLRLLLTVFFFNWYYSKQ